MKAHSHYIIALCLLVAFLTGVHATGPVYASLCQITNISNNYPQPVQPDQQFQLSTTINALCDPSAISREDIYYLALVAVQDGNSGQEITTNSVPVGYVPLLQPNVTITVTNLITPPGGNGAWRIRVIVYIINDDGEYFNQYEDTVLAQYVTINVGTLQQTISTSTTTSLPTISSQISISSSSMTSNETTPSTATSLQSTALSSESAVPSQALTIIGLAILTILLITLWKRRRGVKLDNNQANKADS